jgi:hypothetical protein
MDSVLQRFALKHWVATGMTLWSLLSPGDWIALEWSAVTYASRVLAQALLGVGQGATFGDSAQAVAR